jgi:hypothetical protein
LSEANLAAVTNAAIDQWVETFGSDDQRLAALSGVRVVIADLNGSTLGLALGDTVWIDVDAAGYGWFIDSTPYDNAEFGPRNASGELIANPTSEAYGNMDLLTVVMHELGHVLGFEDLDSEANLLMSRTLYAGERLTVGETNNQVQDDSANLVIMDEATGQFSSEESIRAENSWLHSWLLRGVVDDEYDINQDIQIIIPREESKDNPNLRRMYGKGKRA